MDSVYLILGVKVLHSRFILLLIDPGLVSLQQVDHLYWLHEAVAVFVKQGKDLLKLHICHVYLIALFVEAFSKRVNFLNNLEHDGFFELSLLLSVVLAEDLDKVGVSTLSEIVHRLLDALLVSGVKDG